VLKEEEVQFEIIGYLGEKMESVAPTARGRPGNLPIE
jgi:hypothetical protein